jgi:hypothetical protein
MTLGPAIYKTGLGRAIRYLLNHQVAFRRFESNGGNPIDNMAAEHNFVSVALTRKNFLFAGSDAGGERGAIVYTILQCCRLAGVEPVEYLTDVLRVLSGKIRLVDVPTLMPSPSAYTAASRLRGRTRDLGETGSRGTSPKGPPVPCAASSRAGRVL